MDQAKRLKFERHRVHGLLERRYAGWSGEYHPANIIILVICGTIAGYLWYLGMRWAFQRLRLLPLNGDHGRETP